LRIGRQSGDSGADWLSCFKGLRQIPYAAGRELFRQGQGTFFAQAGNSSVGTGMLGIDWFVESISTEFGFDRYLPVL
jgi:hypothetical protein